jgi:hypothetical protein
MTLGMELPRANGDRLMMALLPMSMVTAIVSPRARPRARKAPPMMPGRA